MTRRCPLTKEQEKFLSTVAGPALEAERSTGIPASVTIAQAILESGWGRSSLFRLAHNPFGIKDSKFIDQYESDHGNYGEYVAETKEWADAKLEILRQNFAKFEDLTHAFIAHSYLFLKLNRYALAASLRHDWRQFAVAIMNGGYSTDRPGLCGQPGCSHYAGKLIRLVEQYKLDDRATLEKYRDSGLGIRDSGASAESAPSAEVKQ